MMNRIVQSLRSGHPVCWEGDISEPGFLFGDGFAVLKHEDKKVTAERRQASFEAHRTTDDHVMEIVGWPTTSTAVASSSAKIVGEQPIATMVLCS